MQGSIVKYVGPRGVSWQVRLDLGDDPVTGRRRQRMKTFRTKREAEAALALWRVELARGMAVDQSKQTLAEYLQHWLDHSIQHSVRRSTYVSYEMLIRVHIVPTLGGVLLAKLQPRHFEVLYAAKLAGGRADGNQGGLSHRTVLYLHSILRHALGQATRQRLIPRNPTDEVTPPRRQRPRLKTWDAEQVQAFLAVAEGDGYAPIWLLALTTGMRIGELLGLRWADVDLARACLSVCEQATTVSGAIDVGEPKSPSSRRTISLSPVTVAALRAHRAAQVEHRLAIGPAWRDHDLVLASEVGTHISAPNVNNRMAVLMQGAGVPRIRVHDLRHTHATLLLQAGENVKVVSERLGHASVKITLDTYAHVLPNMQRAAAERIDAALFAPPSEALVKKS